MAAAPDRLLTRAGRARDTADMADEPGRPAAVGWVQTNARVVGAVASVGCVVLAVVWLRVVPAEVDAASGARAWLLRYGHSAVWALLAVAAAFVAGGAPARVASRIGTVALAVYAAFVLALLG